MCCLRSLWFTCDSTDASIGTCGSERLEPTKNNTYFTCELCFLNQSKQDGSSKHCLRDRKNLEDFLGSSPWKESFRAKHCSDTPVLLGVASRGAEWQARGFK